MIKWSEGVLYSVANCSAVTPPWLQHISHGHAIVSSTTPVTMGTTNVAGNSSGPILYTCVVWCVRGAVWMGVGGGACLCRCGKICVPVQMVPPSPSHNAK